jgi:glutamyl-tRNA reductase
MDDGIQLYLIGASHNSAPLGLRECMSLDSDRRASLDAALLKIEGLSGSVVLNTCNRVELYLAAETPGPINTARDIFGRITGLDAAGFARYGYEKRGREAALHLMEVCAGLDSQMIGETEIMGQVKQAYAAATERGGVGPVLHRLFQKSFQAAKWAREHSGVGLGQVSLGAVAVELSRRIHGDLSASRVMIVGSGQVGADVARALQLRGARDIVVTSRTPGHADALATEIKARTAPFANWQDDLASCDIAILCTSSPAPLLGQDAVRAIMGKRRARPLFIIDLAVPLDAEPSIGDLPDVFLYTFADLAATANENMKGRMHEVDACRKDLSARAERLWADLEKRGATGARDGDEDCLTSQSGAESAG